MSFDLGPIKRPMIQESQNMQNNGGGGNLGYMSGGEKKEEKDKNKDNETNLLQKNDDVDTIDISVIDSEFFEKDSAVNVKFNPKELINKITDKIKHKLNPVPNNPFHP